ncbi:MAG: heme-binding domain-containing protein [Flavobacteriaceae bacterium]|nr:heme-binding domain-containing protein [Flavobacteriaceae bacterium]
MKIVKKIGVFLLVVLLVMQFFGPDKNEGEASSLEAFITETNPPENVKMIFKENCFDCHSNVTKYPWYFSITPVNYWMAEHIEDGKDELNFSKWAEYSLKRKEHKFEEVWEEVAKKKMPLDSYTWTHSEASLSQEQIDLVVNWAKQIQEGYKNQLKTQ